MIAIENKKDCCGCSACVSVCPQKAINLVTDEDGFKYPSINESLCTNCKLCEKVCPFINNKPYLFKNGISNNELIDKKIKISVNSIKSYVCYNNDIHIRNNSTSGGFFSIIANYIIDEGGYVCGATFDDKNNVCHRITNQKKDIAQFRGSKYVQSNIRNIYNKIKELLDDGKKVLFSGTPCQVEGLLNYIQKSYTNLITVDLVCHGVGSEKYWNKYKEYMEWKYKSKIKKVSFREKTYGYNSSCMAIYFENGRNSKKGHNGDMYLLPFFSDYILRPSCYECKIKKIDRNADFTMGDFWDCSNLSGNFRDANGCTLLMCNNKKAHILFDGLKEKMTFKEISLKEALLINSGSNYSMVLKSTEMPTNRTEFFKELENIDYKKLPNLLEKYMPLSLKEKIACFVKPVLYRLRILETVKKILK